MLSETCLFLFCILSFTGVQCIKHKKFKSCYNVYLSFFSHHLTGSTPGRVDFTSEFNTALWHGSPGSRGLAQLVTSHPPSGNMKLMNSCVQLALFLYDLGYQPREWCRPQWSGLHTSVNLMKITLHKWAQRPVSQVILDLIHMTIEINHHSF